MPFFIIYEFLANVDVFVCVSVYACSHTHKKKLFHPSKNTTTMLLMMIMAMTMMMIIQVFTPK